MKRSANAVVSTLLFTLSLLGCLALGTPARAGLAGSSDEEAGYLYYPEYRKGMLRWSSGEFSAFFGARLQIHAAGWVGGDALLTNGDLMERPGFRLRRSRLYFGGQFVDGVSFLLSAEFFDREKTGGPLLDAYIDATPWPWIGATLGVMYFPFAKTAMVSSGSLPHLDRARVAEALSPGREMGLLLHAHPWVDHLTIYAGVFNGLRRSEFPHMGYEGVGVSFGNRFEGAAYVVRMELEPLGPVGPGVADLTHSEDFRFGLGGAFFYDDGRTLSTMGWSAYLHMRWMGAHVLAEYIGDRAEPAAEPTTEAPISAVTRRMGVVGEVGYVILPELLGLALRVEWLDLDTDFDDHHDEVIITATATVYAVRDLLKLQVEYTHREELHGDGVDNDAVLAGVQLSF